MAGVRRHRLLFSWGSLLAGWRYLDYKFKSDSPVQDLTLNGPMFGVAFQW